MDTYHGVFSEAADCFGTRDWLAPNQFCELTDLVCCRAPGRSSDQQITLFKSVGTALQDIALAVKIYQNAQARGLGEKF